MSKGVDSGGAGTLIRFEHPPSSGIRSDAEAMRLLDLVAKRYAVSIEDLLQPNRGSAPLAHARQVAMYLCGVALGRRLSQVARLFGRDRSTVHHACGRIEDLRDDGAFDAALAEMEDALASTEDADASEEGARRAAR